MWQHLQFSIFKSGPARHLPTQSQAQQMPGKLGYLTLTYIAIVPVSGTPGYLISLRQGELLKENTSSHLWRSEDYPMVAGPSPFNSQDGALALHRHIIAWCMNLLDICICNSEDEPGLGCVNYPNHRWQQDLDQHLQLSSHVQRQHLLPLDYRLLTC